MLIFKTSDPMIFYSYSRLVPSVSMAMLKGRGLGRVKNTGSFAESSSFTFWNDIENKRRNNILDAKTERILGCQMVTDTGKYDLSSNP